MTDEQRNNGEHDEYIRAATRGEEQVKALTESMRDLKRAVEELIDRVDADIDTLRAKSEGFAVTASAVEDLKRRMTIAETKVEMLGLDNATMTAKLETALIDRTKIETRLEAVSVRVWMMSGAAGVLAWIAGKLFR